MKNELMFRTIKVVGVDDAGNVRNAEKIIFRTEHKFFPTDTDYRDCSKLFVTFYLP